MFCSSFVLGPRSVNVVLVVNVLSSFVMTLMWKKRTGSKTLIVFLLSCGCLCTVSFPRGVLVCSVACDRGIA